ncbi:hypothetical protein INR49_009777 [Caranx melampygus]|nr:hypothetical protein INR49_009777 [Caranx melampygus]
MAHSTNSESLMATLTSTMVWVSVEDILTSRAHTKFTTKNTRLMKRKSRYSGSLWPEGERPQSVGRHKVLEVEGEEHGAQGRPQQAQEQEHRLVAEALVSVPQHQPELHVDEDEEEGVEDGVDDRQAQGDVRRHGRAQSGERQGLVHRQRLLLLRHGLHDLLSLAGSRSRSGGEGGESLCRCSPPVSGLTDPACRSRGGEARALESKAAERGCQEEGEERHGGERRGRTSCSRAGDSRRERHMISDENGAFVRASSGRKLLQRAAARREETGPAPASTAPLPCSLRDATHPGPKEDIVRLFDELIRMYMHGWGIGPNATTTKCAKLTLSIPAYSQSDHITLGISFRNMNRGGMGDLTFLSLVLVDFSALSTPPRVSPTLSELSVVESVRHSPLTWLE